MNHQLFEEWLLDREILTPKQKRELQAHLQACPDCSTLAEVDVALRSTRMVTPAAGFTDRFQVRLERRKQALRRRNYWGFLLLTLGVIAALLWLAWPLLSPVIQSPVNTLASWLSWLIALWTSLQAMGRVSELIFQVLPSFVPPVIWLVITLGAGGWGLLWILSLMKLTKIPQGV
jgi:uncharacterized membrane protein YhaH (DUF805 family)